MAPSTYRPAALTNLIPTTTNSASAVALIVPELRGRYVFGDFLSGRLWALDLPPASATAGHKPDGIAAVHSLGRWGVLVSSFGRTADGEVLVADYGSGAIYQIVAAP